MKMLNYLKDYLGYEDEILSIQEQFNKVVAFSQYGFSSEDKVRSDGLFDKWLKNKSIFFRGFGNKFIYEFEEPVEVQLSDEIKKQKIEAFISKTIDENFDLAMFIQRNKDIFFSGYLEEDYLYNGTTIKKGSKIIKSFKYFVQNDSTLRKKQDEASMLIQENKIRGRLCLSIHPLDYLSVSENDSGWRSCHALDGDYRAGNLEYMADSSTIVCYLKTSDDAKLPRFPREVHWNNKIWRMLLFVSDMQNALFAGRHYPFFSADLMERIKIKFNDLFIKNNYEGLSLSPWTNHQISEIETNDLFNNKYLTNVREDFRYVCIDGRINKLENFINSKQSNLLYYNDLLLSSYYTPYYCFVHSFFEIHWTIGQNFPCLMCGEDSADTSDSFLCDSCELQFGDSQDEKFTYCDICGEKIYREAGHWVDSYSGGEFFICQSCYDENVITCDKCGTEIFSEDACMDENGSMICMDCKYAKNITYY